MKILLLHPGSLGDVILSLPAVALLREKYPAARITIAGNTDHLMPVVHGYAEKVISLSAVPLHNLYSVAALPDSAVSFWKSFDQIVSWTGLGDSGFVQQLKSICPTALIASWKPDPHERRHVSQLFVDSLGSGIASGKNAGHAPVYLKPESCSEGMQWLRDQGWEDGEPLVALHPGAGSKSKRWPLSGFISLARHLIQLRERRVLIIEGPAEQGLAEQIVQEMPKDKLMLAKSLSLEVLAPVIARAEAFVGNDSGIAHLAAALGIRSVVLFGPTQPRHWAPVGPHVNVIQADCLESIRVEDVIRSLGCGNLLAPWEISFEVENLTAKG